MKFEIRKGVPIPADSRADAANAHTFPWGDLENGDGFVIPKSYWLERGTEEAKYSQAKARERVRGHFKQWKDKEPEKRAGHILIVRNDRDEAIAVWLKIAEEAKPEAATGTPNPLATEGKKAA